MTESRAWVPGYGDRVRLVAVHPDDAERCHQYYDIGDEFVVDESYEEDEPSWAYVESTIVFPGWRCRVELVEKWEPTDEERAAFGLPPRGEP